MGVGVNGCIAIAPTPLASRLLTTSAEGLLGSARVCLPMCAGLL
jgi:hypothetical protein